MQNCSENNNNNLPIQNDRHQHFCNQQRLIWLIICKKERIIYKHAELFSLTMFFHWQSIHLIPNTKDQWWHSVTYSQLLSAWAFDYYNYENKHYVPQKGDTIFLQ